MAATSYSAEGKGGVVAIGKCMKFECNSWMRLNGKTFGVMTGIYSRL